MSEEADGGELTGEQYACALVGKRGGTRSHAVNMAPIPSERCVLFVHVIRN